MLSRRFTELVAVITLLTLTHVCFAAGDWPMWRYDAGHSAASPTDLPEELHLQWTREFPPRVQVWDDPLNHDLMQYDKVFEPIVMEKRVFIGFNDSDKVVALDIETGEQIWSFYTDGPVRLSPVAWNDRLFVASDDGHLYCLNAADGSLVWKFRGGPSDRKVLGNKRVISMWPARGGPVLRDDKVYFAASIWPMMGTFIYALEAETGKIHWVNDGTGAQYIKQPHGAPAFAGVAPQGTMVATKDTLLVLGGRSVPAALDRKTGKLLYFRINDGGKGTGGSFVIANNSEFYVHTRQRGVRQFDLESGDKSDVTMNEPVLDGRTLYTATEKAVMAVDKKNKVKWEIEADGSGDLIKAGSRLYAAGKDSLVAISLPTRDAEAKVLWSIPVDGEIVRLVAAGGKLLAVTLDGRILTYGAGSTEDKVIRLAVKAIPNTPKIHAQAIVEQAQAQQGYALCYGVDDAKLLDAVLATSELHIVAIDPDAEKVDRLRRRYDAAGLYGTRVTLHQGDPLTFQAPPYIANLVIVGKTLAAKYATDEFLGAIYASVRPYGGAVWFPPSRDMATRLASLVDTRRLAKAKVMTAAHGEFLFREGSLPGAAPWTHLYGNIANTVKSDDQRVKTPLGILWFGGSSNMDVLPRHGHGPCEQVVAGRLFIEGMNSLSARDVYTGRVLWKREFADLGTFDIFFDDTYKNTPLDPAYNQVHLPGSNSRGTNYVATQEGVYLVIGSECHVLDVKTGDTINVIRLPAKADGSPSGRWTYIGVYRDMLLAGTEYANYTQRIEGVEYKKKGKKGPAWSPDLFGALGLVAFDRHTGDVLWRIDARHSFLHNAIVAGNGRVYCLDKLPSRVEDQLARRGKTSPDTYRLLALDAGSGDVLWEVTEHVFGTWLGYSEQHDILLQAGADAPDRSPDEVGEGLVTIRGADGSTIWEKMDRDYAGPCILHNDLIITNSRSYTTTSGVFSLLDGSPVLTTNPITGKEEPWSYSRTYGCNTAVASENLLTFRSGAAGYYDLNAKCGVGNLGGFRAGCSSNLIVADGVLNAPDYTRTCSCGYQNQTSLALIHMPDVETWTVSEFGDFKTEGWLQRVGINLGAPGDRTATDGTLWIEYPIVSGDSSPVIMATAGNDVETFRRHASAVSGAGPAWVAASGVRNMNLLSILLKPTSGGDSEPTYTVRLHFAEPDEIEVGQRVFDVGIQGQTVLKDFDVISQAGGRLCGVTREFPNVNLNGFLTITLTPKAGQEYGPILAGVELIAE